MKKVLSLLCTALSIVLMALPISATLTFAPGPGQSMNQTFSYFDLTVLGYGNLFPLLTGVLAMVAILLLLIFIFSTKLRTAALVCLALGTVAAVFSLFFSTALNLWGVLISILLAGATTLLTLEQNPTQSE